MWGLALTPKLSEPINQGCLCVKVSSRLELRNQRYGAITIRFGIDLLLIFK